MKSLSSFALDAKEKQVFSQTYTSNYASTAIYFPTLGLSGELANLLQLDRASGSLKFGEAPSNGQPMNIHRFNPLSPYAVAFSYAADNLTLNAADFNAIARYSLTPLNGG